MSDVLRVVLVGAESTGKTTLAAALADSLATIWVPEFAREHWDEKLRAHRPGDAPPFWTSDDLLEIARTQQARENELASQAKGILVCDTNAWSTGTWHERYYGRRDERIDAIGAADIAHLYLVTAPDIPFVQDGVRDGEQIRDWMHARFLEQLAAGKKPFVLLTGPQTKRHAEALQAIYALKVSSD